MSRLKKEYTKDAAVVVSVADERKEIMAYFDDERFPRSSILLYRHLWGERIFDESVQDRKMIGHDLVVRVGLVEKKFTRAGREFLAKTQEFENFGMVESLAVGERFPLLLYTLDSGNSYREDIQDMDISRRLPVAQMYLIDADGNPVIETLWSEE